MNNKTKQTFFYDNFSDRLMIRNIENSNEVVGSVRLLNLIIDLTANSRIANIEILEIYLTTKNNNFYINIKSILSNGDINNFVYSYESEKTRDLDVYDLSIINSICN